MSWKCSPRLWLRILNGVLFLLSLATFINGVEMLTKFGPMLNYYPEMLSNDKIIIQGSAILCVSLGAFGVLTCLVGSFAEYKGRDYLLKDFSSTLVLFCSCILAGALVALLQRKWTYELIEQALLYEKSRNVADGLLKFANNQYSCCGVYNLPTCDMTYPGKSCQMGTTACAMGCFDSVWDNLLSESLFTAAAILLAFTVLTLVVGFLGCCITNDVA